MRSPFNDPITVMVGRVLGVEGEGAEFNNQALHVKVAY